MAGRFGGPMSEESLLRRLANERGRTLVSVVRREAFLKTIPTCRTCGVRCTVCTAGGVFGKCCLETAESGETYNVEMASVKRELRE